MVPMLTIGQKVLGRYQVADLVSDGGQASVAKGLDASTGQAVAIRQLSVSPDEPHYQQELGRFQRAASLRIGSPHVVDPIDSGEENGCWYMILPFIEGQNLEAYLARHGGRLAATEATAILRQATLGVAACHAAGITHRDIKPGNLLIDDRDQVRIIDLGICSIAFQPTLTQGQGFQGSLHWAAPEQIREPGCRDPRLDLYALGATSYFLLTGHPPVQAGTPDQIMLSICEWTPPAPRELDPAVPENLDRLCMRLLEKQPENRFQTAEEVIQALDRIHGRSGQRFCLACGRSVEAAARFCLVCGASQHMEGSVSTRCFACGAPVENARSCPYCGRLFGSTHHRVSFTTGSLAGLTFRIPEGIYDVGREALAARDQHISRRQLTVACVNGEVFIQDARSANHTLVAGRLAEGPVLLESDVELTIAGSKGTYCSR